MKKKVLTQDAKKNAPPMVSMEKMPPSIHIRGPHAKALNNVKPGQRVSLHVTGKLMEHGISEYGGEPHARLEVSRIRRTQKVSKPKS